MAITAVKDARTSNAPGARSAACFARGKAAARVSRSIARAENRMKQPARIQVRRVTCPTCGASPGHPCVDLSPRGHGGAPGRHVREANHRARVERFQFERLPPSLRDPLKVLERGREVEKLWFGADKKNC